MLIGEDFRGYIYGVPELGLWHQKQVRNRSPYTQIQSSEESHRHSNFDLQWLEVILYFRILFCFTDAI